jgi:hypothetical protein
MNPEKPRCSGNNKAGKPCSAAPTSSGLCFFHSHPAKASELGRIGGRKNRRFPSHDTSLVLTSQGAQSVRDGLAFLYENVLSRRIGPAQATALLKITELQLKLEERTDLSKLEKLYDELKQVIETREVESAEPEDPFAEDEEEHHEHG